MMDKINKLSLIAVHLLAAALCWVWREQFDLQTLFVLLILFEIMDIKSRVIKFCKKQNLGYCDACGEFDRLDSFLMCRHQQGYIAEVKEALAAAETKHPDYPKDLYRQLAIIGEEFGELQQAVLQADYEGHCSSKIKEEALHLAAMALRFLKNLDEVQE